MARPKPEIPAAQMPLRIPPGVKAGLEQLAALGEQSLNATCVEIFRKELRRKKIAA
jgi:hypothetical protein